MIGSTSVLSEKLGLKPKVGKPSKAIQLRKRGGAASLPKPGSHAALVQRLFSTGKG